MKDFFILFSKHLLHNDLNKYKQIDVKATDMQAQNRRE